MSIPLSDSVAAVLRSDSTAALAAAFVIASHHPGILQWAASVLAHEEPAAPAEPAKPNGSARPRKAPKSRVRTANGSKPAAYNARRRATRDEMDAGLLEAMRASPGATIGDLAEAIGRSRTATIAGLKRLRDQNLASNEDGVWSLVETPPEPREPVAPWIAPLKAPRERAHTHA